MLVWCQRMILVKNEISIWAFYFLYWYVSLVEKSSNSQKIKREKRKHKRGTKKWEKINIIKFSIVKKKR